ncbi:hypothetical protein ANCDUO_11702 [Ancylostoma duodenale]|uniref:Kindlin-2 N-terminal domain-containing protein n=1 Tax=Ancylostoma duodenale TaxID=51022 RepID=A0A0C2D7J7_9BILA|nr:hypothetical protein ANCDUO_11702 [Ancylostoma duodenale]
MAHLVVDGLAASDGSWSLPILVTDMNIQRNLYVRGDLHIGGLMMRLVDEIDPQQLNMKPKRYTSFERSYYETSAIHASGFTRDFMLLVFHSDAPRLYTAGCEYNELLT